MIVQVSGKYGNYASRLPDRIMSLDCYLATPKAWEWSAFDRPQGIRDKANFTGKNGVPPGRNLRDQISGIFLSRRDIWHVCMFCDAVKMTIVLGLGLLRIIKYGHTRLQSRTLGRTVKKGWPISQVNVACKMPLPVHGVDVVYVDHIFRIYNDIWLKYCQLLCLATSKRQLLIKCTGG